MTLEHRRPDTGVDDWIFSDWGEDIAVEYVPGVEPPVQIVHVCQQCEHAVQIETDARELSTMLAGLLRSQQRHDLATLIDTQVVDQLEEQY